MMPSNLGTTPSPTTHAVVGSKAGSSTRRGTRLRALLIAVAFAGGAATGPTALAEKTGPSVIELFTSQSCYSCPPAEALLGELAGRDDIVALEFHVDYWNDLVYGSAGRWEDPFSEREFTLRQRIYAGTIPGSQVYTPQLVIDAVAETVGSRQGRVMRLLDRAVKVPKPLQVTVRREESAPEQLMVEIAHAPGDGTSGQRPRTEGAQVLLARFDRRHTTEVPAGENKGKTLTNHHVVRELLSLGEWRDEGRQEFTIASAATADGNSGCAVLVQAPGQGPMLGAALCP